MLLCFYCVIGPNLKTFKYKIMQLKRNKSKYEFTELSAEKDLINILIMLS